jgi:mono/diheme cytochrome c family protein
MKILRTALLGLSLATICAVTTQSQILPKPIIGDTSPQTILSKPIADGIQNAALLRRGQYLVRMGDCVSCHMREGGSALEGGLGLKTPFGVIYSSNITPDKHTGIGAWSGNQFFRAMHDGVGAHGENLYPAFPYPWFRNVTHADDDAIFAYLKSTPAVRYTPPKNDLPFPFNIRFVLKGWNLLFLNSRASSNNTSQSTNWNRGRYIVDGLGHCSACHSPKNLLGADKSGSAFEGGNLDNWVAPDLTENTRTGLGAWHDAEIAEFLKTGRNIRAAAGGSMGDVISYSTTWLTDQDRAAIAIYIKVLPARPEDQTQSANLGAMKHGAAIYSDVCTACHLENGVGQPRYFPPLTGDAMLQQPDPTGLVHAILGGSRTGPSQTRPSPMTMPSFAWKLSDQEVADVSTYIRNSWGNRASQVTADQVKKLRSALGLDRPHYTANSGDRLQ